MLLGTFMGGMCLGSLALPRLIGPERHPLRVYAALELGIALLGLALLFGLPFLDDLYAVTALHGWMGVALRAVIAAACLLPPTLLMGATLPAVARWVEATPEGVSWLGFFYGSNIAGAVCGSLLAGFYLLRVYDMAVATYVAAAINVTVAVVAMLAAGAHQIQKSEIRIQKAHEASTKASAYSALRTPHSAFPIYLSIALSGLTALGAEVVWTRLLSLVIGGTVYTFSIILAVFLIGLGIGSSAGAVLGRSTNARLALGICQLLLATAIAWTAWTITQSLAWWPINPSLTRNAWDGFQLDLLRCLWAIFPAACLWGASFPLALAAAANSRPHAPREESVTRSVTTTVSDPARLVASVYAANTIGAIVGALAFSTLIIGSLGTQRAQQILVGVTALSAFIALAPRKSPANNSEPQFLRILAITIAIALALLFARAVPPTPGELIAHGRRLPTRTGQYTILEAREGLNASVAVTVVDGSTRNFHVSGKIEASSEPQDMRLQRMLGHIPALVHPHPKSVLIVGCGAGVTAGSFVVHPEVERIVICEIEPLIPTIVANYFSLENHGVVQDKRVEIIYDDARHFILTTQEKFDVITSDPINPWVKGAATLYTREYFQRCRQRLNPGGVITQWVPLYESNLAAVKSELATFFEIFPEGTLWSNDQDGQGYDVVLLGQADPLKIDVPQLAARLNSSNHAATAASLYEVGFRNPFDILATFAGVAADLQPWLADAQINRDRNLRLQYLAGLDANTYHERQIYNEILKYRKYPDQLFIATDAVHQEIRHRLGLETSQP